MDTVLDSKLLASKRVGEFKCSGSEVSLSECKYSTTSTYCSSEYAGVICTTEPNGKQLFSVGNVDYIIVAIYMECVHTESSTSSFNLTTILLVVSITITLLLIAILLLILRYTVKRFRPKPSHTQPQRERQESTRSTRTRTRIVHTQLDPEVPYAVTAPPSYADTLLADRRVQERSNAAAEDEEINLISADTLSSEQTHV